MVIEDADQPTPVPLSKADFEALARFRFGVRRYLRVSEEIVRAHGLTPQQYQLMLALMGFPGREWASVQELAGTTTVEALPGVVIDWNELIARIPPST